MKKEDLFGIISDIDDKYILEAHEEDLATSSEAAISEAASTVESESAASPAEAESASPAVSAPISKRPRRIRILIPVAAGIAALAAVCFGLWKSGIFSKKEDPVIEHKDTVIEVTDYIDPELSDVEVVVTNDVTKTFVTITGTDPTAFTGWAELTVLVPADKMIEKDGKKVPSELTVRLTNLVDHPFYVDSPIFLQKLNEDGEWETYAELSSDSIPQADQKLPAKFTTDFSLDLDTEHVELQEGRTRLVMEIQFYEPSENNWEEVEANLERDTLAAEFYI